MRLDNLQLKRAVSAVLFILLLSAVGMTKVFAQSFYVDALQYSVNSDGTTVTVTGHVDGMAANGDHAFVDLGLPSGLLWATCNIGANTPEEYGDYFAWGETQPKDVYNWSTYQYCMGSYNTLTKYCTDPNYGYNGFTDDLTILLPEDDAATANWGNGWRMPTEGEWQELYSNTTVTLIQQNGVNGCLFTAANDNSLFLPAAGYRWDSNLDLVGSNGDYWSSSLGTGSDRAWYFLFDPNGYYMRNFGRRGLGRSVRAVRSASPALSYIITATANPTEGGTITGAGEYDYNSTCTLTATANNGYTFFRWTENETVVSTDATYSFVITEDRNLVADFTINTYNVTVTANPIEGGIVIGTGRYDYGTSVTIAATANYGYIFNNWTEGGNVVSTSSTYSFPVTSDRNLVANFTEASTNMLILSNESGADGSTVTMSVDMINIEDIAGFNFDIVMNEHISYVAGSAALTDRATPNHILIAQLINDGAILRILCYSMPGANFVGNSGPIATFDLVITGEESVTYTVELDILSISTIQGYTPDVIAIDGSVTIIPGFTITATANPPEGGTVIGAGTYEEGETCTLTAIANEGYTFVNWTENDEVVSSDSIYSFQVTTIRQLVANFSYNNVGTGLLNGIFSVNENVQVSFSQGNLQYRASTNTWRFANNQYDYIGNGNTNVSPSYSGWIDLFGWGTSGYNHGAVCYQPWSTSVNNSDYYAYGSSDKNLNDQTGQADWGYNAISNGGNATNQWRTLTYDEWNYMLNTRSTISGIRFAMANVNEVDGVILMPDNWDNSLYTLNNANSIYASYSSNTISGIDWMNILEPAGVVFLPKNGYRWGTSWYRNRGDYWASTHMSSNTAYALYFYDGYLTLSTSHNRADGKAVRLIQVVQAPSCIITTSADPVEGGTVTEGGTFDYGQTCTVIATPNEGYSFCSWTENGLVVSYSPTYTFVVRGDRDLVANFGNCPPRCNVIFNLYDSYGDGWNGASLNVSFSDGSPTQSLTIEDDGGGWWKGESFGERQRTRDGSSASYSILISEGVHVTLNWSSGYYDDECSFTVSYENGEQIYQASYPSSGFLYEFDCNCLGASMFSITATASPADGGVVGGGGTYEEGDTCTLTATPNEGFVFVNWTKNDSIVSTNATYSFTVTENATYIAHFTRLLPELHVTGISHSAMAGGQQATISWTVQNDGTAPTPNGATWNDYVWLSVESCVNTSFGGLLLLGTFENISALNVGESYTQTQTFDIPIDISGDYYLFVLTDVYDAWLINWENNTVPNPYNPPPYISCYSRNNGVIYELSEYEHGYNSSGYYNDNFFYELVDIEVPLVPDLQVTSIIPPDNFFSGTDINVTATISNLGEVTTPNANWTDALYFSQTPDFNTAACLATVAHSGALAVDSSYQVTFTGHIPLTIFGEAYFFVKTDIYEQVYEHINNHNNMTMSNPVNIILTPPADLEPSELVVPVAVSTAENLSYSFKVTNVGAGNPNVTSWVDKVYISTEDTFGTDAILLKTHSHYGNLTPASYYSVNGSVSLPSNVNSGFYYVYVVVDANSLVFEYLNEDNNLLQSSLISVTSPDLQITEMMAPEQITSGYPINLSYTLINNGDGAISNRNITDKIYISNTESLNGATQIAQMWHNVNLPVGQSMTVTCNATAPTGLTDGTFHLIVVADGNNEIHESNEGNNTLSQYPMPVMHQPLPDLQPVSFNLPSTIQAGEAVNVDFDITNLGDLDLLNSNCSFNVYALQSGYEILCPVQTQTLPLGSNVSIGIGQTVHFVRSILVPASVTSACTTFKLYADKGNRVTESNENNNTITTNASVIDCPLPDLTVSNFTLPAIQAGTEAQVSFTVSNQGTADFSGSFGTAVYANVNRTQIQCPLWQQIAPETTNYSLAIGESLSFTLKVLVPPTVTSACTSFSVKLDEANTVLETNENNNTANAAATVTNYPFNLTTQTFTVPSTVTAGETTNISWTVKNTGTCPNGQIPFYIKNGNSYSLVEGDYLPSPWKDRIYLSDDANLDNNDTQLLAVDHNTVLNPNGIYNVEQTVTLPYSAVGLKYLLCVSDATELTFDNNRTDNIAVVPITVELGVLPDLHITALTVEPVLTSDNAYWVHYTVINEGERVTQRDNWMDAFYISENYAVTGAIQLGSKIHNGALAMGASYTDSIEILVPNGMDGDYYLLGYTDATNLIYEYTNENNNLLGVTVTVVAPDPCDLIAIQPEFPNYAVSGEEMTVSWQLRNIGANPAVGRVRNAIYLSTDAAWSSDDVMLGYANVDINIAANQQQACSLSGSLTGIAEGHYYVIVKANILNALNESSYENNICVSLLTTEVGFPLLAIGEQVDRSMTSDQYIYYKLQVGPEYEGQTLSCALTTMEQQVANGLYLSHEAVPTLSQYDFGRYAPYAQEIEILIPALEQGDYYLLAKGSTQNGSPQQVSIATSIINFEILHIDANHGSNTGSITTKVTGAKFDSIMDFRLVQGGEYLPAEKVFFSNSTETYTTFDLVDMPAGTYAMEAELPGGIITIKGEAFTIEEGLPAELAVNIVAPSSVRRGNTFPVNIEYGNIGTTDLNVSGFVVVSRNGHPIGFTSDELAEGLTERVFSTAEANGNPDVLRPGYRATKTILVDANTLTSVSLQVYAIRKQY